MKVAKRPGVVRLILVGAFVAALGVFALAVPHVAGTAVAVLIGAALVIAGAGEIVQSFSHPSLGRKLASLILGVITAAAGAIALAEPWLELAVLTILLACALLASGVWRVGAAWSFRETNGWLWLALSGVVGIALGVMILMGWPESSLWAIGTLVGVDLLMTGVAMIALGVALGRIVSTAEKAFGDGPDPPAAPMA